MLQVPKPAVEILPYLQMRRHPFILYHPQGEQLRAEHKRRLFPTIEYASRVSHFDPNSDYRDFQGFFALFWIALTVMAVTTMLRNVKDTGYPMRVQIWQLFTVKVWELALADGFMVATSAVSLPLHCFLRQSVVGLKWDGFSMALQSIYQAVWFAFWVIVPFQRNWTWTAQVFLTLHTLVLLMKMHSYAFYNGHLSIAEKRLQALDNPVTASRSLKARHSKSRNERRVSEHGAAPPDEPDEKSSLATLREGLAMELTSPLGSVAYPQNLTWWNYTDYIFCPTLCYVLEYPRTTGIVWTQLWSKIMAAFGVIFLLTITSEEFILPALIKSTSRLESAFSFTDTALILAETISMLLFPFVITFLLVFLVIRICPRSLGRDYVLYGSALLQRLVELDRLARVFS